MVAAVELHGTACCVGYEQASLNVGPRHSRDLEPSRVGNRLGQGPARSGGYMIFRGKFAVTAK